MSRSFMSRSRIKILSLFLFLFWTFSPSLSRHTYRCAASASRMSDYGEGVKFSFSPVKRFSGYSPGNGASLTPQPASVTSIKGGENNVDPARVESSQQATPPSLHLSAPEITLKGAQRIVWQNNFLYTAGAQNFSILDPSCAQMAGAVAQMAGAVAQVAGAGAQVAGAQKPVIVGSCMAPALCLAISGQYAYLGSENGKLHMIDISNPAKPVQLRLALKGGNNEADAVEESAGEENAWPSSSSIQGMALLGSDILVLSDKLAGISLMEISLMNASNLQLPKVVGNWKEVGKDGPVQYGDLVGKDGPVQYGDLVGKDGPVQYGDLVGKDGPVQYGDLTVWENRAAVLWTSAPSCPSPAAGFWLIDLSCPQKPVGLAKVISDNGPLEIAASGAHLFLANGKKQSLEIYAITPSQSQMVHKVGSYPVGGGTRMLAAGDTLYLAQGDAGVLCLDISLPDHPIWIGQKKSGGCCIDLAAGGNGEIYLLNKGHGSGQDLGQGSGQNTGQGSGQCSGQESGQNTGQESGQNSGQESVQGPGQCSGQDLSISGIVSQAADEMALVPEILTGKYLARNSMARNSMASNSMASNSMASNSITNNSMANRFGWTFPFFRRDPADTGDSCPVILSVSPGYAQAGALITLQGKRLSAQSSANWIHFSESQGSFEDTTGWKRQTNCWVRDNWECWAPTEAKRDDDAIFDSQVAVLGNQSYRNNIHYTRQDWKYARECPGKGEFYNLTWWDAPDADQYYYRYYVRYSGPPFQWTDISWKQLYVHNLFNLNPCMWDNPPPGRGPARYDIQGQDRIFAHLPDTLALERWYCIEVWVKKNGPGLNLKFWLDGEECGIYDEHDQSPQKFPWSKCYQEKNQKLIFGPLELGTTNCQNWKYEQLPVNQSIWFDGFAISSTRIYPASLVEIGNLSDYATATKIRQEILHISDTQIQFRVNTAGLGRGPYYVWVTNNKQERSKAYSLKVYPLKVQN